MGLFQRRGTELRCIECGGDVFTVVNQVALVSFDAQGAKARMAGFRVSCQHCGAIFTVGPNGPFRQHPQALPWAPVPPPVKVPAGVSVPSNPPATISTDPPASVRMPADSRPRPKLPTSGV